MAMIASFCLIAQGLRYYIDSKKKHQDDIPMDDIELEPGVSTDDNNTGSVDDTDSGWYPDDHIGNQNIIKIHDQETGEEFRIGMGICLESYPCQHFLYDDNGAEIGRISAVGIYNLFERNGLEPPEHFEYVRR